MLPGSVDSTNDLLLELIEEALSLLGNLLNNLLDAVGNLAKAVLGLVLGRSLTLVGRAEDFAEVALATTVPGEQVDGVAGNLGQNVLGSNGNDVLLELLGRKLVGSKLRVRVGSERKEVGQKTSNVRRSHGSTRDGVDGVVGTNPGGLDVETGSKDVDALAVVGEVCAGIVEGGCTNGDGLLGSGGRVVARIGVVVTGSNGEMQTSLHGGVDGSVESRRLATTKGHVGGRTLELGILLFCPLEMLESSILNTLNDVGHGSGTVGPQHLDGDDVGLLGDTILLAADSTGAVSSVTVSILIGITLRNGLAPPGAALKVNVVDVGASINNVNINTLTAVGLVNVLVVCGEAKRLPVRDTSQAPWSRVLSSRLIKSMDDRVLLDVCNLENVMSAFENQTVLSGAPCDFYSRVGWGCAGVCVTYIGMLAN